MASFRNSEPIPRRFSLPALRVNPIAENGLGVVLALGGGFSRGFAHLGVLEVLENEHIAVSAIAGTSIGGLLGAAYADGVSIADLCELGSRVRVRDFIRYQKFVDTDRVQSSSGETSTQFNAQKHDLIGCFVRDWMRAKYIEQLAIPTAIVTTNLDTCAPHVFTRGPVEIAIRATCAFPGLFRPVPHEGKFLADGCIVAPVPTEVAARMSAGCVLGVAVGATMSNAAPAEEHAAKTSWARHADIIIEPDVHHIEWNDFSRAEEARAAGADAMRRAIPRVREWLERQSQLVLAEKSWNRVQPRLA